MTPVDFSVAGKRVYVAGHRGMVGSALVRRLASENCASVLTTSRKDTDLRDPASVETWFARHRPEVVLLAAAKVGGIQANDTLRAEFIYDNVMIAANVIHAAHSHDVEKLLFLGSSCIYPKHAAQPICEDELLTGPLEPTNEPYAIAKIAGLKMAESYRRQYGCDFISAMPTNLYGLGDNYHPENSHVVAALLRRFHDAKIRDAPEVVVWGSGTPRREFLFVDDLAEACVTLLKHYSAELPINIGVGKDVTIAELAALVAEVVGFCGTPTFDRTRPDGAPQKLLDVSRIAELGWRARTSLRDGLRIAYREFVTHHASADQADSKTA